MSKNYLVSCYKAPYSEAPTGWSLQYFTTLKDAREYAASTVAEEITIEVYKDGEWVNDHIEQIHLETITL